MWTFTTYILYAFIKNLKDKNKNKPLKIPLNSLWDFEAEELIKKRGLILHGNASELEKDIKLLSGLGIIAYDPGSKTIIIEIEHSELLKKIAESMRHDPMREKIPLIDWYLKTIEDTIEES